MVCQALHWIPWLDVPWRLGEGLVENVSKIHLVQIQMLFKTCTEQGSTHKKCRLFLLNNLGSFPLSPTSIPFHWRYEVRNHWPHQTQTPVIEPFFTILWSWSLPFPVQCVCSLNSCSVCGYRCNSWWVTWSKGGLSCGAWRWGDRLDIPPPFVNSQTCKAKSTK